LKVEALHKTSNNTCNCSADIARPQNHTLFWLFLFYLYYLTMYIRIYILTSLSISTLLSLFSCFLYFIKNNWSELTRYVIESLSFALYRCTSNGRQRKILRYQAIKSKLTCCFKTEIRNYSFDTRKKIWNVNIQRKFCQENSNLPFAVPGNEKLKLPNKQAYLKEWVELILL
jgi:hypothetical protein